MPGKGKAPTGAASAPGGKRTARERGFEKVAVELPAELVARIRAAAYFTPGATVTGIIARGAAAEVARLERKHGRPFGKPGPLPRGRRVRHR